MTTSIYQNIAKDEAATAATFEIEVIFDIS